MWGRRIFFLLKVTLLCLGVGTSCALLGWLFLNIDQKQAWTTAIAFGAVGAAAGTVLVFLEWRVWRHARAQAQSKMLDPQGDPVKK